MFEAEFIDSENLDHGDQRLATQSDSGSGAFGGVVVDFQTAIGAMPDQWDPTASA